ncbi:MAG: 50S ribosomal protein L32 [Omnitrophica bacterium RIFCSPHIGHO2_02_FULL_46_11]|nr:MAG: 50S ribosomal protein L32 [Omnitrophica bacterium RIFCSPHIGHO2_02_FULL_46_11]
MANPKRRHSNTRTRLRRTHDRVKLKSLAKCPNCGHLAIPHRICVQCGYYRGRQVITIAAKGKKEEPGTNS